MLKIAEEIKNLELDKPGRGKSIEQIKKHTIPESFSNKPIDRALQLLTNGDDIQKVSILYGLPDLFKVDANATCTRIIPKILQELQASSCEFHIASSKSLKFVIEKRLPINVIPSILQGLESKDPVVVRAWLDMLVDVMGSIPEEVIRKEILPIALAKANVSQGINARVVSCALLGKLSVYPKFVQKDVKSVILPSVQSLCQDCSADVRSAICSQISNVCQGLGQDMPKSTIISSLVELASDNVAGVRSTAVMTIVKILPLLDPTVKKQIILPLVKQLCEKSQSREDVTGTVITKEIGPLLLGLLICMVQSDIEWFLNCFKILAHRGLSTKPGDIKGDPAMDMVCRDNCAYNFPAVANIIATKAKTQLEIVYSIFRDLTADPCYIVRKTVAASIHEIIKILGANSKVIKADVVRLLRDDAEEVLLSLVPNLGTILILLNQQGILIKDKADQSTMEIGRALLKCQLELTKGYNWRLLTTLLQQLERLPDCMPADFIHQHFTPVVMGNVINGRAKPIREQGAKTLLIFLKFNQKEAHQKWIRETLVSQLCYSKSSYTRIIYIKMCRHALDVFPPQYFKDFFFQPLLILLDDRISNVRYTVVCMLPILRQLLTPNDPKSKQNLGEALVRMELKETDKDVLDKLKSKAKELADLRAGVKVSIIKRASVFTMPNTTASTVQPIKNIKQAVPQTQSIQSASVGGGARPPVKAVPAVPSAQKSVSYPQSTPQKSAPAQMKSGGAPQTSSTIRKPSPGPGDMSFLEQHFYVDAGINIPLKHDSKLSLLNSHIPVVVSSTSDIEGLTKNEIETLQNSTTNITDDIKVNLRKLSEQSSKLQQPKTYNTNTKINKRHSSILFSTPTQSTSKTLNRRSLNIPQKDLSKIPVPSKNFKKDKEKTTIINKKIECVDKENTKINYFDKISGNNKKSYCTEKNNVSAAKKTELNTDNNLIKENLVPSKSIICKAQLPSGLPLAIKKSTTGPL